MNPHEKKVLKNRFTKRIQEMELSYLQCRDMRHAWVAVTPFLVAPDDTGEVYRLLECTRCTTTRADWFITTKSEGLVKTGVVYSYPTGYQLPGYSKLDDTQQYIREEEFRRERGSSE